MEAIVFLVIGWLCGFSFKCVYDYCRRPTGDILVTRDEDGTYLSLEIDDLRDVTSKEKVTFRVITRK